LTATATATCGKHRDDGFASLAPAFGSGLGDDLAELLHDVERGNAISERFALTA